MKKPVYPYLITPPSVTPKVHAWGKQVAPDSPGFIRVPLHRDRGPLANCYWNAADRAQTNGGKMVLGWALHIWPRNFYDLMHHAVWQDPNGKMHDVTEPLYFNKARHIYFLPSSDLPIDLDSVHYYPNHYLNIAKNPELIKVQNRYIEAYNERLNVQRETTQLTIGYGLSTQRNWDAARTRTPMDPNFSMPAENFSTDTITKLERLQSRQSELFRESAQLIQSMYALTGLPKEKKGRR